MQEPADDSMLYQRFKAPSLSIFLHSTTESDGPGHLFFSRQKHKLDCWIPVIIFVVWDGVWFLPFSVTFELSNITNIR